MKKSIAVAVLILVLGAVPGVLQQKRLGELLEANSKLVAKALSLGVVLEPGDGLDVPRLTKRRREDLDKQALKKSEEVLGFARELDAARKRGEKPDSAFEGRAMEMLSQLGEFDASQIKVFVDALRADSGISASTRGSLMAFAMMSLADSNPEAAVALYAEGAEDLRKSMLGEQVVNSALSKWAETRPDLAVAWIRDHGDQVKGVDLEDLKAGVVGGAARNDATLAFKLIDQLKFDDTTGAVAAIVSTGHEGPEQRDAVMAGLRSYLASITDPQKRDEVGDKALEMFARTAESEGFETLTTWMENAKFTEKEKQQFAGGLSWFTIKEDTGRWVEWMGSNLPADELPDPVREIVGEWTQQDYVAAGQWLKQAPQGPAKTAAVEAYAGAVAEYEPQIAVQWAMTLQPGPARESTLRAIYQNWPEGDPQGAAAFAREHGIE